MNETLMPRLHYFSEYGSECAKCCNTHRTVKYHAAKAPNVGIDGCRWPDEHLHLTCNRCGYQWACHPKDMAVAAALSPLSQREGTPE